MKSFKSLIVLALLAVSSLCASASTPMSPPTFTAASYNLRQANHSDSVAGNGWGRRLPVLAELIRFHGFDIFGTQEGFKHQLDSLVNRLPGYAYTGIGREDGKEEGEHSAIFYRTDLFELLDHGDFWLSETPEKPGLGWDAVCPRICSWGKFLHRPSGQVFVMMNLHMDHVGKKARIEAAKLVKRRIDEVSNGAPAIVTGDFNVDQSHNSYRTMLGDGDMADAFEVAEIRYAPNGTFNSYLTDGYSPSRIDHLFVTPTVKVNRYGILTDTYRTDHGEDAQAASLSAAPDEIEAVRCTPRTPSDHFPVMVQLTLPEVDGPGSLGGVYNSILGSTVLEELPDEMIFDNVGMKGFRGMSAVAGNAEPRAAILEAVSAIPSSMVLANFVDNGDNITRLYYKPSDSVPGKGEALMIIVGHGPADTVVLYMPEVEKSKLIERVYR